MKLFIFLLVLSFTSLAQTQMSLEDFSKKYNEDLPVNYDQITRLMKTTVEGQNFIFNFIIRATQAEYNSATPKVKAQVMKTVCSQAKEKALLKNYRANLVYRYENEKGQSLGEFMVKPEQCQ